MNRWEKEVQQSLLDSEESALKELEAQYARALKDINEKVKGFQADIDLLDEALSQDGLDDAARALLQSQKRSKVYQQQYQKALQGQVSGILDKLHGDNYATIEAYLKGCYEDGYIGTMYDIAKQGVPVIVPIDQAAAVKAILTDSKVSNGLYNALGVDVAKLKKTITQEISRGIASSLPYRDIARNIGNVSGAPLSRAKTIARTEGHRIQQTSSRDAQYAAKAKGADVVKQWDAALDGRTRDSHRRVDGEIRELDEKFSNGLMFPGDPSGSAAEVVNCRCTSNTRARWALGEEELQTLKERAEYFGLDKTDSFEEYKQKYLNLPANADIMSAKILKQPIESSEEHYKKLLDSLKQLDSKVGCAYNPVVNHTKAVSESEIIKALAGGDRTSGSCASVGLAYVGQKQGWNVLDFRDGESRRFFSSSLNLHTLSEADGLKVLRADGASSITVGNRLLKMCESGKEYYLCVGRHSAIVRKTDDGVLQYLELQSATRSGWTDFNGNPRYTLKNRFGCTQTSGSSAYYDFMIDLNDSNFDTDDFRSLLGYINTTENEQRKGSNGAIK
nr:MAG TPA: minor capsid protein [Caudoviricetes sp.]